ncbi:hypothetical protein M2318_005490, partial [Metapseudomonas resinovorans]
MAAPGAGAAHGSELHSDALLNKDVRSQLGVVVD